MEYKEHTIKDYYNYNTSMIVWMISHFCERVSYEVTGCFGLSQEGEIKEAVKLTEDPDSGIALLFHPADDSGCGSFEFAMMGKDGYWKSCSDLFVNLPEENNDT